MTSKAYYSVTCFMNLEPSSLFPLLLPLQFKWSEKQTLHWENEQTSFRIVPFSTRGTESMGYRLKFSGSPDSFTYLMEHFLSAFEPSFSGIEWIYPTEYSQDALVKMAETHGYTRCSMYGIYESNHVGIVLMKTGEVNCQIRNRGLTIRNIASYMKAIEEVATAFQPKCYDLFSLLEEEGVMVS